MNMFIMKFQCSSTIMPSTHGAIFCSKELREKVGVKVWFFLWLSQRTRPIFCRKQLREKIGKISAHFLSELLCVTIAGEVSLLDDVTPIFYQTEVSAHGPIFCRKQLREKNGAILYRSKSQHTRTNFHSDFLSTIKKIGPCALGIKGGWDCCLTHSCNFTSVNSYIPTVSLRVK